MEAPTPQTLAPPACALTRQHDTRDILDTRVMPSTDCYTDHRLVHCKVTFTFKSPPKRKSPKTKKLQVHKLCDPGVKNNIQVMLEERLHCVTTAEPEKQWKQMKTGNRHCTKSCSKRNVFATIICWQNLMIKLPRMHARLPAVHSRLSLGPCRIIGRQDLRENTTVS